MGQTLLKIIILFILSGFCLVFCTHKKVYRKTLDINDLISETFILPTHPAWNIANRDTTIRLTNNPKLIIYFSAEECMPCALKELNHWTPITDYMNALRSDSICCDPIFILHADRNDRRIRETVAQQNLSIPVMYDQDGEFEKHNLLPANNLIRAFLLDTAHRVVFAGNPLLSLKQQRTFESLVRGFGKKPNYK